MASSVESQCKDAQLAPEETPCPLPKATCDENGNVVAATESCCCCCIPSSPPRMPDSDGLCAPPKQTVKLSYCEELAKQIISKCEAAGEVNPCPESPPAPRPSLNDCTCCTAAVEVSVVGIVDSPCGPSVAAAEDTNNSGSPCNLNCFSAQDNSCDVPPLFYDGDDSSKGGRCSCK